MEIKSIGLFGSFNERTGYGVHTSRMAESLEKIVTVNRNAPGDVNITLIDVVSIQNVAGRLPYPSICYSVWESTQYPSWFHEKLKFFDQLWTPSEWQKAISIADGIPEEFVHVVPEGVDPDTFFPIIQNAHCTFDFLHIGQWQPRKSTLEIVQSFLLAFTDNPNVRLYLSADTLFPSDEYKSTEERLAANGIFDSRIIPVHFEERDAYVRRLQNADCFVSCARSEGWGLPIIEAMACGVPAICADFGGSTEYASDAITVRIKELIKPYGIFGNWEVPGQWAEPDFDHLVEQMKDVYENYSKHKSNALALSETIRTKFSWDAAAQKAMQIIEQIPTTICTTDNNVVNSETYKTNIRRECAKKNMAVVFKPRKAIFSVDCWPNSQAKIMTLVETIQQIHDEGFPVLVTSHYPLPAPVIEQADFYIYEKEDRMSGDDKPVYWKRLSNGEVRSKVANVEYQGVAALNCFRNAIDFVRGKYDWLYHFSADMEVDLGEWLDKVYACEKDTVCIPYEGIKDGIGGGLWAGKVDLLDRIIPYLWTWKEYADRYPDLRFVVERWQYKYVTSIIKPEEIGWIECETINRFDNVDHETMAGLGNDGWGDDVFEHNFIDGAYFNIVGISNREYEVVFGNPIDGDRCYSLMQKPGMWARPNNKFYRDWMITAKLNGETKFELKINLEDKKVLISMGSKALGDTLAWIPYVEEFRKKHKCQVVCSTWWNKILDYPEIEFVEPGSRVEGIYATYNVGCYDDQLDKNPVNWRLCPLQKVSADILGIDYVPMKAKLKVEGSYEGKKPYICFSEFSTMQGKLWNNPGGWQKVVDHLNGLGYDCVSISAEKSELKNIVSQNNKTIESTLATMAGCEFYVGLNHGPSWIAYSLGKPCIMLTGMSEIWNDFENPYRLSVVTTCPRPCFNNPDVPIDRAFGWCPHESDKFVCTRAITPEQVFAKIEQVRNG